MKSQYQKDVTTYKRLWKKLLKEKEEKEQRRAERNRIVFEYYTKLNGGELCQVTEL